MRTHIRGRLVGVAWRSLAVAVVLTTAGSSCGPDVGDDASLPGPAGVEEGGEAASDATVSVGDAASDATEPDAATGDGADAAEEAGLGDAGAGAGNDAAGGPVGNGSDEDAGADQASATEATAGTSLDGGADATADTVSDAGDAAGHDVLHEAASGVAPDATVHDAGALDTAAEAVPDATAADVRAEAAVDGGESDAGEEDAAVDAGAAGEDAGADAATEAGGGLVPCTSSPCAAGAVPCDGNTDGVCSPTEALLVARDIARGAVTGGVLRPADSCYECLVNAACIDDARFGDRGKECGDLTGTEMSGAGVGKTNAQLCLDALSCSLSTACAASLTEGISACYCGPNETDLATCSAAADQNGACLQPQLDGLGLTTSASPSDVLALMSKGIDTASPSATLPSQMADALFICAATGDPPQCPQCTE